ncbi:antibiotic biosynthesis monooxygenase [Mycolicibacterium litorale]|uniref:Antibiotic biosynthesis monooxygenase n=1 Tax=Mycolicibacterium litorale TaxID=758802 RepID=A0A6S6P290_9MYCO|nr:antibiotic biosynthesis monooxygenase family protein [Mycolicibacterium litorale]BCI52565.1 antibiotic biosynthesis monooxygenase [Mycolicibacterium litorale]
MTVTIEQRSPHVTLINVFTVEPQNATALVDLLSQATEDVMRHQDGFRSANIHLSADRTRVVNYAQWDSQEAYRRMLADPVAREHMASAAALAVGFDPHLYTVEAVHSVR